ncbi:MAG: ParB/RepB/Spo0J family partition protein [Bdellovibrionota bacterium]
MSGASKKKRGLGRGLGALISARPVPVGGVASDAAVDGALTVSIQGPASRSIVPSSTGSEQGALTKKTSGGQVVNLATNQSSSTRSADIEGSSSGDVQSEVEGSPAVRFVPIKSVCPNPDQPRKHFEEAEVEELVSSIRNHGVLQPILVRPMPEGSETQEGEFQSVAGERRWRSATRAKLSHVPVIIRDIDDRDCLEISLIENVQRSNLTPLEEARGYQELISRFQLTQAEVAEKVGKERASVANMVRLLRLPPSVQGLIDQGVISVGHAKAILTVKEPKLQVTLASKVVEEGLSVRELERIVSRKVSLKGGASPMMKGGTRKSKKYQDLIEELQRRLASRVSVREGAKGKGKLVVEFSSFDEFERIVEQICFPAQ